ncbi:MAG: hypothetical protein JGK21_02890 [Microcoleus sp. PH2017_22_RUC_O_B]|uniref:hypothetical protein n=1 Tax=unclassified Microcoleus TaxID=2642155 RepID=UPI001D474AD5|nr:MULTISPECIES: hypothetical protein [unclassified Microcoleus]MCC3527166.1 hypothetical protein [Microcoleus sp. PH2017_21_RUC_O_A]MCC3539343.1 hypothetical protein [Microcoleus sp. PH2017_22_RUC_O_B]
MTKKVLIDYNDVATIVLKSVLPHGWRSFIPGYDIYKLWIEPLAQKIIDAATLSQGNDLENIKEIIRSGKENGVDELEIKIAKEAGINIGANLDEIGVPCNVNFRVGSQGETVINIKYK